MFAGYVANPYMTVKPLSEDEIGECGGQCSVCSLRIKELFAELKRTKIFSINTSEVEALVFLLIDSSKDGTQAVTS